MPSKEEVELFLHQLREKMQIFDIVFRPRQTNMETLSELEILPIDRIKLIKQLTSNNYYAGPKNDTYDIAKPDYFEFGMIIKGIEVYIKISHGMPNKQIDCMSFHKAKHPIAYPLKKEES